METPNSWTIRDATAEDYHGVCDLFDEDVFEAGCSKHVLVNDHCAVLSNGGQNAVICGGYFFFIGGNDGAFRQRGASAIYCYTVDCNLHV